MKRIILLLPVALLTACETIPDASIGKCDATRVQNFVGALAIADVGATLLKRSGARTLRWLAPGSMATMDYRQDRLNLRIDGRNFVTALDCG